MSSKLGFLGGVTALLAAGCGDSDVEKFANELCGEVAKCCGQLGLPADGKLCRTLYTMPGAESAYNASAGEACLAEVRAQVSAGTFCSGSNSSPSACDSVFDQGGGNKKPGEDCDFDDDCAPASEGEVTCASAYNGSDWVHKCQVRMPGHAGDTPCLGTQDGNVFSSYGSGVTEDVPPSGYVCDTADDLECSAGACVALAAVGETCSYSDDCVRSAYCDAGDRCSARLAPGSTCTGSDASECADGYYCPAASPRQCTAKLADGASCATSSECRSGYCDGGNCQADPFSTGIWSLLCGGN